jgi:hypothetical protein
VSFESRPINEKDVEPAIVIEIEKSGSAARGLQQVRVPLFSAENCFAVQAGFPRHVHELHGERRRQCASDLIEGKNSGGPADRADELTARFQVNIVRGDGRLRLFLTWEKAGPQRTMACPTHQPWKCSLFN